jgi:DNA-binding MarR family transcriptional regulator
MTEEKVVPVEEVQRIKKYVDDVLKNSISLSSSEKISVRPEKSDLDEKEKTILDYIKNNPGVIKQTIVDAFKIKVGYSRKPVLKIVNNLERYGLIIVRPDKENIRKHHLFTNNENALVLLIEILDSFKQNYFTIIDSVEMLDDNTISNMAFIEKSNLIESIILPFKSFILLMQYNLFGQSETPSNKLILDKKFGMIHTAMQ